MERVSTADLDSTQTTGGADRQTLSDSLGTTDVALNRYVLAPGQRLSSMHAHLDQEEVFFVLDGEATFETRSGELTLGEGEAVRFGRGEFQAGKNDASERTVLLAIGAPRDSEAVRIARIPGIGEVACPDCGHDSGRPTTGDDGAELLACPECGTEWDPESA